MTGPIKNDKGKAKLSLIDPEFRMAMARVLNFGEVTYGPANWMKGLSYSRIIDAMGRHLASIESGQDIDPDTNEYHAVHIATGAMFLAYYMRNKRNELDDRRFSNSQSLPGMQEKTDPKCVLTITSDTWGLDMPQMLEGKTEKPEDPIRTLQKRIAVWADKVFPNRTPTNSFNKLIKEEVPELIEAYENGGYIDPEELADVFILVIDVAYLLHMDVVSAAHRKMSINENRKWTIDETTGLMHHVKGSK